MCVCVCVCVCARAIVAVVIAILGKSYVMVTTVVLLLAVLEYTHIHSTEQTGTTDH